MNRQSAFFVPALRAQPPKTIFISTGITVSVSINAHCMRIITRLYPAAYRPHAAFFTKTVRRICHFLCRKQPYPAISLRLPFQILHIRQQNNGVLFLFAERRLIKILVQPFAKRRFLPCDRDVFIVIILTVERSVRHHIKRISVVF